MQINAFSRNKIVEVAENLTNPAIIISIKDKYSQPQIFPESENLKGVKTVFFNDEETNEDAMTFAQAKEICDFVRSHLLDNSDLDIWVHCNAGVSRSAGVAAALLLVLTGDDSQIFQDGSRCPNMNCYRLMLKAMGMTLSEEEISEKEKVNLAFWTKKAIESGLLEE